MKPSVAETGWMIDSNELLDLAPPPEPVSGEPVILLDLLPEATDAVCLYRLLRVNGSSRDRTTQLLFEFAVLVDGAVTEPPAEFKLNFTLPISHQPRILCEVMQLGGGTGGGSWKWQRPSMSIGATLVAPLPAKTAPANA